MMPTLANDSAGQTDLEVNPMERVGLREKLLVIVPLPIGCYLLLNGLLLAGDSGNDPLFALARGLVRSFESMGGFVCFYFSLRTYFKIRRVKREGRLKSVSALG